jgi:hypothetical protein
MLQCIRTRHFVCDDDLENCTGRFRSSAEKLVDKRFRVPANPGSAYHWKRIAELKPDRRTGTKKVTESTGSAILDNAAIAGFSAVQTWKLAGSAADSITYTAFGSIPLTGVFYPTRFSRMT